MINAPIAGPDDHDLPRLATQSALLVISTRDMGTWLPSTAML
jgi:hypothetical protein